MYRKIDNTNNRIICRLLQNIDNGIKSMIIDYNELYTSEEITKLKVASNIIEKEIVNIEQGEINNDRIIEILNYEDTLKELVFRCWETEVENGNEFISWYKYDKTRNLSSVISSTFGNDDSFCNSRYGISFDVELAGFIGACNKDAATIIESPDRQSIYTIGKTQDGKVINSYNLATTIITPIQVFDKSDNTYMSKHNEIILDSKHVRPKSVIYTDENDLEMVNMISKQFNIPIEFKKNGYTK